MMLRSLLIVATPQYTHTHIHTYTHTHTYTHVSLCVCVYVCMSRISVTCNTWMVYDLWIPFMYNLWMSFGLPGIWSVDTIHMLPFICLLFVCYHSYVTIHMLRWSSRYMICRYHSYVTIHMFIIRMLPFICYHSYVTIHMLPFICYQWRAWSVDSGYHSCVIWRWLFAF